MVAHHCFAFNSIFFFATLYCQFSSNCENSSGNTYLYRNGVLNINGIQSYSPSTCNSSGGANWYYYSSSQTFSSSSFCPSNDIVLVNGDVDITNNITGSTNLLIISNGSITVSGNVTNIDAFLMAMYQIKILN